MVKATRPKKFAIFMPDLSLPAANLWNNVGNLALIMGAFLVLAGTWLTIWTGGAKERFADERISGNETLTQTAKADAAKAIEETERLKNDNLKLSLQLEAEKSARLKIESGLASRNVSNVKKPMLIDELKKIDPKPIIQIQRLVGDTETKRFGDQLIECFNSAGIRSTDFTIGMSPGFPDGVTIVSSDLPESNKLVAALQAVGFSPVVKHGATPPGFSAVVLIGLKPPSF